MELHVDIVYSFRDLIFIIRPVAQVVCWGVGEWGGGVGGCKAWLSGIS